jgi:hypothetical protein
MTVRELKETLSHLPDDAEVVIGWADGRIPQDHEPGVELVGIHAFSGDDGPHPPQLTVSVGLFYLDDE